MKKFALVLFALLFLLANASALTPSVDFNWYANGSLNPNPLVFSSVVFDPKIIVNLPIQNIWWQFDTDGNVNYVGGTSTVFSDYFTSGLLPQWTTVSGTWTAASNYLSNSELNTEIYADGDVNFLDSNYQWNFSFYCAGSGVHNCRTLVANQSGIGNYKFQNDSGQFRFFNPNGVVLISGGGFAFSTLYDVNITRNQTGDWNVIVNGSSIGTANDTEFTSSETYFYLINSDAASEARWDNFSLTRSASTINGDLNETHVFTTTGTKRVVLTVKTALDGTITVFHDFTVTGNAGIQVFDENTGAPLVNTHAIFNGVTYDSNSGGFIIIPIAMSPGEYEVVVYDANHYPRTFTFFSDLNTAFSQQVYLIDNNTARIIDFLIRDVNNVKYPDKIFRIEKNGKLVWKSRTDSDAKVFSIPLANLTTDYNFFIDNNTLTTTNIFSYGDSNVNVSVPINEKDFSTVTPFSIKVTELTSIDANNLSATFTFKIYPNTLHPYKIQLDANTLSYFPRYYHIRAKGGENPINLQPYMLRPADSAALSTFTVNDSFTGQSLPYILIKFFTDFGTQTHVLVESQQTDFSGEFLFSTITGKSYNLEVYNEDGDLLFSRPFLSSTATTYFLNLFNGTIDSPIPTTGFVDLNVLIPTGGTIFYNDQNEYVFRFKVVSNHVDVTRVTYRATQNGLTIASDETNPVFPATTIPNGTQIDFNFTSGVTTSPVVITVTFYTANGNLTKSATYFLRDSQNFSFTFPNLTSEIGEFGGIVLWFLGFLVLSFVLRFNPLFGVDNSAMIWILVFWTALAGFIGLINVFFGFIALLLGVVYWSLKNRPLG